MEQVPSRPEGATAWIDGEWVWMHARWYWLVGRWVKAPPGARYAPWVAEFASDGSTYWAPGVWLDAHGQPMPPPPALALARPSRGAVVDAEGNVDVAGRTITDVPTWTYRRGAGGAGGAAGAAGEGGSGTQGEQQ